MATALTLMLLTLPQLALYAGWQEWRPLSGSGCLSDSELTSVACTRRRSDVECLSGANGFNAAQWRASDGVCCVLDQRGVCRLPSAGASECRVFVRFARLVDFARSLSDRLVGAWVTDPAAAAGEFVDVACGSAGVSGSRFVQSNIAWSAEGATFNGVNSYMLINTTGVLDRSQGLTWLMRLRRAPRPQPFVEVANLRSHLWEYHEATRLYFNNVKPSTYEISTSASGTLPNDASAWVNVGVSLNASTDSVQLFVGDSFLPASQITKTSGASSVLPTEALVLGHRLSSSYCLQGTVSAFAVANSTMTQEEIRSFFASLP